MNLLTFNFIVVVVALLKMACGERTIVLNFNDVTSKTLKILHNPAIDESLVTKESLKTFIGLKLKSEIINDIELFDRKKSTFDAQFLSIPVTGPLLVLVKLHSDDKSDVAAIEGRRWNFDDGLLVNSTTLRVRELPISTTTTVASTDAPDSTCDQPQTDLDGNTGLSLWDGAVVLAKYLELHPSLCQDKSVLELGSGTGLVGMAAFVLGANTVLLTDLEYSIGNIQHNINAHFKPTDPSTHSAGGTTISADGTYGTNAGGTTVSVNRSVQYDGQSSTQRCGDTIGEGIKSINAIELDWMNELTYITSPPPRTSCSTNNDSGPAVQGWDIILGADIVWLPHLIPSLVRTLAACSTTNTTVLLAHQTRTLEADRIFFTALSEIFTVTKVAVEEHHAIYRIPHKIGLFKAMKRL